jgi:hypothetical protein
VKPFDPQTHASPPERDPAREADGPSINPAGICHGAGLIVIYGNPAFKRIFGEGSVGLPPERACWVSRGRVSR